MKHTFRMAAATGLVVAAVVGGGSATAADPPTGAYAPAPATVVDAASAALKRLPHRARLDLERTVTIREARDVSFNGSETTRTIVIQQVAAANRARGRMWGLGDSSGGPVFNTVAFDGVNYLIAVKGDLRPRSSTSGFAWTLGNPRSATLRMPNSTRFQSIVGIAGEPGANVRYRGVMTESVARQLLRQLLEVPDAKYFAAMTLERRYVDAVINPSNGRLVEVAVAIDAVLSFTKLREIDPSVPDEALGANAVMTVRTTFEPTVLAKPVVVRRPVGAISAAAAALDSAAKSLIRKSAIALESWYSEHQDFAGVTPTSLKTIEPNIAFTTVAASAGRNQVRVQITDAGRAYVLSTIAGGGATFSYARDTSARVTKRCTMRSGRSCGTW